jgi:hypothetical protein
VPAVDYSKFAALYDALVTDRLALVFIAFHSFEELVDDADRRACLDVVRRHLAPGGTAIVTLHDAALARAAVGERRHELRVATSGRTMTLALETALDPATGIVSGTESFARDREPRPFLELPLRFRLASIAEFRRATTVSGLEVVSILQGFSGRE